MTVHQLRKRIYDFYKNHQRQLPWRYETDPYKILVSEVMLQQTQVLRVIPKYKEWLEKFPTFQSLATSSLQEVLGVWSGLGYNRRGKYVKEAAEKIISDERYEFLICHPERADFLRGAVEGSLNSFETSRIRERFFTSDSEVQNDNDKDQNLIDSGSRLRLSGMTGDEMVLLLQDLPGIGYATACAITTYAFDLPTVFIETNIRAVYLYFFFKKDQNISDKQIAVLVEKTLDYENSRDWYYALTDYGNMLKNKEKFTNTQSRHYTKQSKFMGSKRQVRGFILRLLTQKHEVAEQLLLEELNHFTHDGKEVLRDLVREDLIEKSGTKYKISG